MQQFSLGDPYVIQILMGNRKGQRRLTPDPSPMHAQSDSDSLTKARMAVRSKVARPKIDLIQALLLPHQGTRYGQDCDRRQGSALEEASITPNATTQPATVRRLPISPHGPREPFQPLRAWPARRTRDC
jgi:hypothetical protein